MDRIDADLRRIEVAVAHRDAGRRHLLQRLRELEPDEIDLESTIGTVFRTGEPIRLSGVSGVSDEHPFQVAAGTEHLRILHALGIRSAVAVPMRVGARTVGVITCCTSESQRRLTEADLDLAGQLASRPAMAVDNSRLHTTLSEVAETLQQSLLPSELPLIPSWRVAGLYRPAGAGQRIEVGGDFYEVLARPALHRWGHRDDRASSRALRDRSPPAALAEHAGAQPRDLLAALESSLRLRGRRAQR